MSAVAKHNWASSVILLREAQTRGFEVFLTRRRDQMPSLGENYCFPGGPVHESDYADGMLPRCRGLSAGGAQKILGAHLPPRQAFGFWVAGVRELFDEVGVLLAVKESGEPITWNAVLQVQLLEKRAAFRNGSLPFQSLLESENLFCDAAGLAYFSHWRTPAEFSRSFDTRYFLAVMSDDRTSIATAADLSHGSWLAPDRALQLFSRGELPMTFPTFASLRTLADFGSVQSLRKEFRPDFT